MQRFDLIPGGGLGRTIITIAVACLIANAVVAGQGTDNARSVIPLIDVVDVPFSEAIKNLARQADINCIIDPRLRSGYVGADKKSNLEPLITGRWENLTAKEVLIRILDERGIRFVENPDTTIARITRSKEASRPTGIDLAVKGTNGVIPLIVIDDVSLDDVVQNLARTAQLKIKFDPGLSAASGHRGSSSLFVSLRWENVTARQALSALLNNYDLAAVANGAAGDNTLTIKPYTGAGK